jgi:hypothetical protein
MISPTRWLAAAAALTLFACSAASDDVRLAAPPKGEGFQLGVDPWDVPQGTEQQRCYFFRVPGSGTDPLWIDRIVLAQNPGTHHLNVFRVKTILDLDGEDGDLVDGGECWRSGNWFDWPLVMNSQESNENENIVDWKLPEGVAHRLTPGEKLMLQSHYVNAETQSTPGRAKALVNFYFRKDAGDPQELGTVFATNQNIRICPGDQDKTFTSTCRFARNNPVTILAANGHFHSRGLKFSMTAVGPNNEPIGDRFYTSTEWSDPVWIPDLNVTVPTGGGVGYSCSFGMPQDGCGDPSDVCCATFGPHVETQEHCNAFVYYYPKADDATCF